jgi:hypothetical protein
MFIRGLHLFNLNIVILVSLLCTHQSFSIRAVKNSILLEDNFLNCLLSTTGATIFEPRHINIREVESLHNVDASASAKSAVKIVGAPFGLWNAHPPTMEKKLTFTGNEIMAYLAARYGNGTVKWHFAGDGTTALPELSQVQDSTFFLTLEQALQRMLKVEEQRHLHQQLNVVPISPLASGLPISSSWPSFFRKVWNATAAEGSPFPHRRCSKLLQQQLSMLDLSRATPLYAMASTGVFMVVETAGETRRVQDGSQQKDTRLAERMVQDKIFSTQAIDEMSVFRSRKVPDIDVYFATKMSGTHAHTHGPSVTSTTGHKLWMLYSPQMQHRLISYPQLFRQVELPPMCPETEQQHHLKYMPKSPACFGKLHPLELLNAYESMLELDIAPILLLQRPNEILVVPEQWMHATVNLEAGVSVAYRWGHDFK